MDSCYFHVLGFFLLETRVCMIFLRGCEAIRVINWDEFLFFFFFVMVVANCNASCDWLYVRCSQWIHLDSSLHLSQYGRFHAVSFETASRDAQTLNLPRNVSKFNAQQVVSLMNEQAAKPKVVVQSRAALSYENNELIAQGEDCEELETSAKLTVFVSNILSPHLKRRYTRYVFLFLVFRRL